MLGAAGPLVGKPLELVVVVVVQDHSRTTAKACAQYSCLDASRVAGKGFHCFEAVHSGACVFPDKLGTTYRQRTSPWLEWQAA